MRGNLRSLLRVLARRHLPFFVKSSNPLGMVSVQDLCRAIVAALDAESLPDRVWELSDGVNYTLDDLVAELRGALGLAAPALSLPSPVFHGLAYCAVLAAPLLRSGLSLSTYRTLFEGNYVPDAGFSQHTGFVPQDNFRRRLPELLED